MTTINPKKLLNSKWTAVSPRHKEKHFMITEVEFDEDDIVISCLIEAIINKRSECIDWRDLADGKHWLQGWQ
ncbi:hypothetical protein SIN8267_00963 [Sinobacterium norvegicum]|uniref:TIGR02450 family Trp-rich protein n=1 Tax=Sinobacterium norvegicum TaxID=1641715 RepID=A0ABM9ADS9_9GAMM|nr:TIGR02450 family Trp-rich protein [Sinobacterium norvegicum]CAH0990863.1 hypothetical protein SIN8267_00963 [Sinobacterium norvegicum]